jgi:hypothetical protein
MKKRLPQWLAGVVCLLFAGLSFQGLMDPLIGRAGLDVLSTKNDVYLNETFEKALAGFGVMSGLKAGLAVVEGSTGGVSAGVALNLQIGDVVQSAYDYVDIAWRTLLLGCICLLSMQYLLEMAALVDTVFLGVFFLLLTLWCFLPGRHRILKDGLTLALFAVLVIYLLLPLSILSASALSARITRPAIENATTGFEQAGQQLFPEERALSEGLLARLKEIPERLDQMTQYLRDKSGEMAFWTIQLIAGYLFDCIFFPLGCFFVLFWSTRILLRYCLQCNLNTALYHELRRLKSPE